MVKYSNPHPKIYIRQLFAENKIKTVPGPTRFAVARVTDIESVFELILSNSVRKVILEMKLEERRIFGEKWKELDETHLNTHHPAQKYLNRHKRGSETKHGGGGQQRGQSNRVLPNEVLRAWPLVIFYNKIDVSAYNAFVSWIYPEWNVSKLYKRRIFIQELGKGHQPLQPERGRSTRGLDLVHQNMR